MLGIAASALVFALTRARLSLPYSVAVAWDFGAI